MSSLYLLARDCPESHRTYVDTTPDRTAAYGCVCVCVHAAPACVVSNFVRIPFKTAEVRWFCLILSVSPKGVGGYKAVVGTCTLALFEVLQSYQ